jgi:signal transduction histidine kinase
MAVVQHAATTAEGPAVSEVPRAVNERPVRGRRSARSRLDCWLRPDVIAWPLAAVAVVLVMAINEMSHARSMDALEHLRLRSQASMQIESVLRRLLDAETGQRGYLLTRRRVYLDPYELAANDVAQGLAWLRQHYAQDETSNAMIGELSRHATGRLDELERAIASFDRGAPLGPDAARHSASAVRSLSNQLLAREERLSRIERRAVLDTLFTSRIAVNVTLGGGLLALLLVLRQSAALNTSRREHHARLAAEREHLEAEVQSRTADLSELARHLQTVHEHESNRLAQQLSEELGTVLTTAKLDLVRLRGSLRGPPEALKRLDHLDASIDSGIALKRRIVEDLRPSSLANLGLCTAVQILVRDFAQRTGIGVRSDLRDVALAEGAQLTAYRLVQEALTNIAKYAGASEVEVVLRQREDQHAQVEVSVTDNGRGFRATACGSGGHGLMGMRYRVEAAGGELAVASAPGQGTRLSAVLPMQPASV